jgi:hypothetical protein
VFPLAFFFFFGAAEKKKRSKPLGTQQAFSHSLFFTAISSSVGLVVVYKLSLRLLYFLPHLSA